jgi:hypothetical protein
MASQCADERDNLRCVNGYGCPPTTSASEAGLVSVGDGASYAVRYACACLPPPVPIL